MYTLSIHGQLLSLHEPQVMGILNITPDSFYSGSRTEAEDDICRRLHQLMDEGADMIDVGAYSTRPGADDVSEEEEMERLRRGLRVVRREFPDVPVSVDTFRASVARMAVEEEGADIVNDISGGDMDRQMFRTVARLHVPYVLMHMQGVPRSMQQAPHYDNVRREVMVHLAERVDLLHQMGVADVVVDPGFGFGKTLDHNYELMEHLEDFHELGCPLLVGISRKTMIYKLVGGPPPTAHHRTTELTAVALLKGAHILRVHDVAPAVEAKKMYLKLKSFAQ